VIGGVAIAGDFGTATVGVNSTATAGDFGTAIAGDFSTATVGVGGAAMAGKEGVILLLFQDGDNYVRKVGIIGENGLKPNVLYTLDEKGNFVEREEIK
jgi:hypothetical protein